ncbi:MAG TPA: methyltransferase domain-containing protein [bacterium]|nr:methyltransferase domain-containing protein [bacterium]
MRALNLGCGQKKTDFPEAYRASEIVGIDANPLSNADVIHDLDVFPYPCKSNDFDLVILQDVVEHLQSLPKVLAEVHRILRPGGTVRIRTPHYSSIHAHNDPTHVRCYGAQVFQWFERPTPNNPFGSTSFKLTKREIQFFKIWRLTGVAWLANRFPITYEKYFAFRCPAENLTFELQAIKS